MATGVINPYRILVRDKKEEEKRLLEQKVAAQSHGHYTDEHIDAVTKDFCGWVAGLGGNEDNIEEETVGDLFAIGHESKPPLTVPLKVIQIIDVPAELTPEARQERLKQEEAASKKKASRQKRGKKKKAKGESEDEEEPARKPREFVRKPLLLKQLESQSKPDVGSSQIPFEALKKAASEMEKKHWVYTGTNTSKTTRENLRYGAWYLEPKTWRKLKPGELLQSKESKQHASDIKRKSLLFDEELAPMHVTKAFMSYVAINGKRKPEFFGNIEKLQDEIERAEIARAFETEQFKRRLLSKMYSTAKPERVQPKPVETRKPDTPQSRTLTPMSRQSTKLASPASRQNTPQSRQATPQSRQATPQSRKSKLQSIFTVAKIKKQEKQRFF